MFWTTFEILHDELYTKVTFHVHVVLDEHILNVRSFITRMKRREMSPTCYYYVLS